MEAKKSKNANLENKRSTFIKIGFIFALAIMLVAFEWSAPKKELPDLLFTSISDIDEEVIQITREEKIIPEPPKPNPKLIIKDDLEELIEDPIDFDDPEANQKTEINITNLLSDEPPDTEPVPFFKLEDKPLFMGQPYSYFHKYIGDNLKYPSNIAGYGITGRVFVEFIINEKGEVDNIKIIRSLHPELDAEVLRVIKSSPEWTPGKQRGRPVKVPFTFSVFFKSQYN